MSIMSDEQAGSQAESSRVQILGIFGIISFFPVQSCLVHVHYAHTASATSGPLVCWSRIYADIGVWHCTRCAHFSFCMVEQRGGGLAGSLSLLELELAIHTSDCSC